MDEGKKYLAELLGTFVLVFIGTGSAVVAGTYIGFLGIALAFGLSVLVMVYAIGPISGRHINPAITIAMLAVRKNLRKGCHSLYCCPMCWRCSCIAAPVIDHDRPPWI